MERKNSPARPNYDFCERRSECKNFGTESCRRGSLLAIVMERIICEGDNAPISNEGDDKFRQCKYFVDKNSSEENDD
ncbi:MAG: hypothetical protein LBM09_02210 [Candidatus Nomurabacteria bacterium]|nr:hypothetical protein [Candidatus Nomurabacteria bacterium]